MLLERNNNEYKDIIDRLSQLSTTRLPGIRSRQIPKSIPESISEAVRAKKLDNDGKEQDIALKKQTLKDLFLFLKVETTVVFLLAFLQGFKLYGFTLEDWSFRLVVSATITQITVMLIIAVRHLFPQK